MSDRKYRQRGYQDGGRAGDRRQSSPPRPRREGPRGRGLGAPTETAFQCGDCGQKIPLTEPVAFDAVCAKCGADLHTCSNCRHFDTAAPNECRQAVKERVKRKRARNECTLFEPKLVQIFASERRDAGASDDPRAAFDDLFKL